ncbi:MarR family winged helix-turn-helix transcriptional regulator [Larkinella soli]|uniref:MarR family winged helix-turn-helix transcriptional regulator n=1 Tax=Larkinella soli TaxID=1770527 RepID=UPI000FFB811D|nr:MarR family transcriptional regulator [Larkinella soli]
MVTQEKTKSGVEERIMESFGRLLTFNINHVSHLIARYTNRELNRLGFALQMEQLPVLVLAYYSGEDSPSQQEIANQLQKDKAGIQRSIRTLERDGYLRIVPDLTDRRKNLIKLTPAGKMAVEKILESAVEMDQRLVQSLTEEEAQTLQSLLRKVATRFEQ